MLLRHRERAVPSGGQPMRLTWMRGSIAVMALACAVTTLAQTTTGTITGRALDASGGVLPGVEVSITSPAMIGGARTAFTDEQGVYRFTQLPAGEYRVSFRLSGFKKIGRASCRERV